MFGLDKEGRMVAEYNREDEKGKFRLTGLRNRNQAFNPDTRPKLYYPLYVESDSGKVSILKDDRYVDEVYPDTPDGTKTCWTWGQDKVKKESDLLIAEKTAGEWRIYRKDYLHSEDGDIATTLVKSIWVDKEINNDIGRKEIKELLGSPVMSFPKSRDLIAKLIRTGSAKNDQIVLGNL